MTSDARSSTAAISESVLAVRSADRTGIAVRGGDRIPWLNGLVTCDLAKLTPGKAAYGLIVEKKGKIQSDLFVVPSRDESTLLLAVPRATSEALFATLDHYLVMEDAEIEPIDLAIYQLHGPRAAEVAVAIAAPFGGAVDALGAAVVAGAKDEDVTACVERAGGTIVDDATWEALRIERGLPRFGVEVDATLYPQEAALERVAVSFDKGCYLGQEVVYMLENRGHVKRKLVPLDIEGDEPLLVGAPVTTPEGAAVGDVKSTVLGPASGKTVAIAMVKWAQTKSGTELRVADRVARVR